MAFIFNGTDKVTFSTTAKGTQYDNTNSGLESTNVNDAIDEVVGNIGTSDEMAQLPDPGSSLAANITAVNSKLEWKALIENYTPSNSLNGNVDVTIPDDAKEVLLTVTLNQKLFLVTELVLASKTKGYIVCSYYSSSTEYGSASFYFAELKRCTRLVSGYKAVDNTVSEYFSIYYR